MFLEPAFVRRYRIQHAGNTVRYIVADHVPDVQSGQYHAKCRKNDVQIISLADINMTQQQRRYGVYEHFQHKGRKAAEYTHQQ